MSSRCEATLGSPLLLASPRKIRSVDSVIYVIPTWGFSTNSANLPEIAELSIVFADRRDRRVRIPSLIGLETLRSICHVQPRTAAPLSLFNLLSVDFDSELSTCRDLRPPKRSIPAASITKVLLSTINYRTPTKVRLQFLNHASGDNHSLLPSLLIKLYQPIRKHIVIATILFS